MRLLRTGISKTPSNLNVSEHTLETGDVLEPLAPPLNYLQNSRSLTLHISTPEIDDMILRNADRLAIDNIVAANLSAFLGRLPASEVSHTAGS
ncbi:unnamed protein product [Sphagnum jensenii]